MTKRPDLLLIIQIPCLNEAATLPETLAEIPRTIAGIARVEILVINDGSTDDTVAVARANGVDHIVSFPRNRGLARAYEAGMDACLRLGADIIVNTDADNQYPGRYIPDLIAPILRGEADMVVGDRQVHKVPHFSPLKRRLQALGSRVLSYLAGVPVKDAASGFRAFSREVAQRVVVTSSFTTTTEVIIQVGRSNLSIAWVPMTTNPPTRPSRLFKFMGTYILRQAQTMLQVFVMYRPSVPFFGLALPTGLLGILLTLRFLFFHFTQPEAGHVQSLVIGTGLLVVGLILFVAGLLADLIGRNRMLMERILLRSRKLEQDRRAGQAPQRGALPSPEPEPLALVDAQGALPLGQKP